MLEKKLFRSVMEQDRSPVVLCDLNHTVIFMNSTAAKRYEAEGGYGLIGKSLMGCHNSKSKEIIEKVVSWFAESEENNMIYTFRNDKENKDVYMVALRDEEGTLIGYYEKHEYRSKESAKLYDFSVSLV